MFTPETTAKTEGPMLGSSSILGINDSLLNNNKSLTIRKNNYINKYKIKKLSNYIPLDEKKLFLERNKSALQDYEKFLKITKRNKNNSISNHKNYFIEHYYKSPYKDNPKLIIGSYNTKILGKNAEPRNKKYKVDIIGVDEGYIHLPTFPNNEFSRILNEQDNFDENKNLKEESIIPSIKEKKDKRKSIIKLKDDNKKYLNISYDIIKKKRAKKKKRNMTELPRGMEFMSNIGLTQNENEILEDKKNIYEKMRESFENQNNYKYEIKKLENWDFEHCQKDKLRKFVSKENISQILKKPENSQMKWYLDMKNDKKQLKIMCRNKHLKEFFNRIDKEQRAIFLQSLSVNKKIFDFDIFKNNKKEIPNEKKEEEKLQKIEFYKDVMKEKIKIEEMFHSELTHCAEEVHMSRIRKKQAMIELFEISQKIQEVIKEEQNIKKIFERDKARMNEYTDVLNILSSIAVDKNANKNKSNEKIKTPRKENRISPKKSKRLLNAIKEEVVSEENKRIAMRRGSLQMNRKIINEEKKRQKFKFNLEKLDLTAFHEKADLFQLQSDLIAQKNEIEEKFNKEMKRISSKKNDLEFKFKEKKNEIKNITAYNKKAKSNLDLRIQTLSGYYYQILKNGIDVRKNGLTWVIVKLMELRAYVDKHHLPVFLDNEQSNYIIRVGVKIHELSELIKLFQILKEKQKALKDKHLNEIIKKEKEMQSQNLTTENKKMGNDYTKNIEDIQVKYENVINICLNENREESNINKIKNDLKEQILKSKYDDEFEILNEPELYFIPGTLATFFAKDQRFRQYFDDIFYLNEEINKRKKNILEEKEKEMKIFRNQYDLDENANKTRNKKDGKKTNSLKNEQIYAALFGNGISF